MFGHTFVHSTFPLEQWQVLQSSSHLSPSGVTCPLTEQGLLVTVLNTIAALGQRKVCLLCGFVLYNLVKTSTFLTVGSSPVWWTHATISIDLIHTDGAKGTWRGLALINICHRGEEREVRNGSFLGIKSTARQHTNIGLSSRHTNLIPRLNSLEVMCHLNSTYICTPVNKKQANML